jgi:hypothetical protein
MDETFAIGDRVKTGGFELNSHDRLARVIQRSDRFAAIDDQFVNSIANDPRERRGERG